MVDTAHDMPVFLLIHRIRRIQQIHQLNINIGKFRQLSGCHLIPQAQGFAVLFLRLCGRQARNRIHLRHCLQFLRQLLLLLIIPTGNQQCKDIRCRKGILDFFLRNLRIILRIGRQMLIAVYIRAVLRNQKGRNQANYKNNRCYMAQTNDNIRKACNIRHKISVMCAVDFAAEGIQKTRHQREYRQNTQNNRLNQHHTHIQTNLKVHKCHRSQAGKRCQTAAGNFGNCLAKRRNNGIHRLAALSFLHISVA